jgi:hypothetical protein
MKMERTRRLDTIGIAFFMTPTSSVMAVNYYDILTLRFIY